MKKTFLVLSGVLTLGACEKGISKTEVPSLVKNSFQETYPLAKRVEWEKEDNLFCAEFKLNSKEFEACYTHDASLVRSISEVEFVELPEKIENKLREEYSIYTIDKVEMVEENGLLYYSVELEKWPEEFEITFSDGGSIEWVNNKCE